jgi:predicted transcriptional regulator
MENEAIKLELIEWLAKLDDQETIEYLKAVKDSRAQGKDWWHDLTDAQITGINRGVNDIEQGRTTSHQEVKKKYGL